MSKKTHFAKELKIASKFFNMLDGREYSNTKEDDESVQTTRKLDRVYAKKS